MWKLLSAYLGWRGQAGTRGASQRCAWASKQPNPKLQYPASVRGYPAQQFGGISPRASPTLCVVTAQILYIISWPLSLCSPSSAPIPWWEFSAAFCPWSNPVRLKRKCSISLQSWVILSRCNYSVPSLPLKFCFEIVSHCFLWEKPFYFTWGDCTSERSKVISKCSLKMLSAKSYSGFFIFFQKECSKFVSQQRGWKFRIYMYTSERSLGLEGRGEIIPSSLKADLSSGKVNSITITALISLQYHWEHSNSIK